MNARQLTGLLKLHKHRKHEWSAAERSSQLSMKYLLVQFTTCKYPLKKGKATKTLTGCH